MDAIENDNELSKWFSTYGVITAERILGTYQIKLPHDELLNAIKHSFSFYHKLLKIPLKNILNGIVLQQANEYHLYGQKLFIDYLLSGESSKDAESQGALTRTSLENERQMLVTLGDDYNQLLSKHNDLIARSQRVLIDVAKDWTKAVDTAIKQTNATLKNTGLSVEKNLIRKGISHALIHCDFVTHEALSNKLLFIDIFIEAVKISSADDLKHQLVANMEELLEILLTFNSLTEPFEEEIKEMTEQARSFRTQFYDTVLRVTELIKLLPEYKIDPIQDKINREPLHFDNSIGE